MRKYLLPKNGKFYKANLHSHTNISDGTLSPEQAKKAYMEKGYSIIAFTDHNILLPHHDLSDENFIALSGYELDLYEGWNPEFIPNGKSYLTWKGCHINFIALDPENDTQVCYHRTKYRMIGNGENYRHLAKFDESLPDYERHYSVKGINDIMKIGRENGFYVVYNHPGWSLENYNDYVNYKGMHALEICNGAGIAMGMSDYCPHVYDDILRCGNRISCVGGDDNHNHTPLDKAGNESFTAFTMIKAEEFNYKAITNAMVKGHLYASQGPKIEELYYEDGHIYVKTSPAKKIFLTCGTRRSERAIDPDGKDITSATFRVTPEDIYIRVTVVDKDGMCANSNGYYLDEFVE